MKVVHETVPRRTYVKEDAFYVGGSHVDTLLRHMYHAAAAYRSPAVGREDV